MRWAGRPPVLWLWYLPRRVLPSSLPAHVVPFPLHRYLLRTSPGLRRTILLSLAAPPCSS